jgi:hypothetical protein
LYYGNIQVRSCEGIINEEIIPISFPHHLQYLPCFAAAGQKAQFLAIDRLNLVYPTPISPIMSMGTPEGRAHIILHTVKFYQLLLAQDACYPRSVLMVGKDLVAESPLGFKRTLYVALLIGQTMHVKMASP